MFSGSTWHFNLYLACLYHLRLMYFLIWLSFTLLFVFYIVLSVSSPPHHSFPPYPSPSLTSPVHLSLSLLLSLHSLLPSFSSASRPLSLLSFRTTLFSNVPFTFTINLLAISLVHIFFCSKAVIFKWGEYCPMIHLTVFGAIFGCSIWGR